MSTWQKLKIGSAPNDQMILLSVLFTAFFKYNFAVLDSVSTIWYVYDGSRSWVMKYKKQFNYYGDSFASMSSFVCSSASDYKPAGAVALGSAWGWEMIAAGEWRRRHPKRPSMTLDYRMVVGDYANLKWSLSIKRVLLFCTYILDWDRNAQYSNFGPQKFQIAKRADRCEQLLNGVDTWTNDRLSNTYGNCFAAIPFAFPSARRFLFPGQLNISSLTYHRLKSVAKVLVTSLSD